MRHSLVNAVDFKSIKKASKYDAYGLMVPTFALKLFVDKYESANLFGSYSLK